MKKIVILFSFLFVLLFAGCQKETVKNDTSPATSEETAVVSEQTFIDINTIADDVFSLSGLKTTPTGLTCPAVSWSLNALPFSVTLDWGTGCTGLEGIYRKGKMTISLTGKMNELNSTATFAFDNFYTDGHKVTGVHRITYSGLNTGNSWPRYQIFTEARIDFADGKFITYRANYWRLFSEGSNTNSASDDVWRIEGTSSGTTVDGKAWEATCSSALVKPMSCRWFTKGILVVTPQGEPAITVDFGDGTCDNKATVTKNGVTTTIELR
jgi:hypothetical protein